MSTGAFLLDVTRLVDRQMQGRLPTGVDRVCLEYVRRFGGESRALIRWRGFWVMLSQQDSDRLFAALLLPAEGFNRRVRWWVAKALPRSVLKGLPRGAVLLNMGHSGLDRPNYGVRVRKHGLRPVFFLHDLIPITHPEYARAGEPERHARRVQTMLSNARGIVVNSRDTAHALESHARTHGLPIPPHVIAPLAGARLPLPSPESPLATPYFVMLGTIEPRKNHLLLLHLWREFAKALGGAAPHLVIIGQRGWECEQVVDLLERSAALRGRVVEISRASDVELATWLHHARALVFPSFVEGYGLPLAEALSFGVPVIASDLPVFREIAGEIPEYLDPLDGPGWRRVILDYAQPQSALRAAQLERMQGFKAPTWAEHFSAVESFLRGIGLEIRG
ncbi:glycosyltransferase family 1 protein [Caenispirillum bisanense]